MSRAGIPGSAPTDSPLLINPGDPSEERRLRAWERHTAWGLPLFALVFLAAYAAPILHPELPARWRVLCHDVTIAVWLLFGLEYATRVFLAHHRLRFVRRNLFDLIVLVLPAVGPLRLVRLVEVLLVLNRRTAVWARGRLAVYVGTATVLLVLVSALAVLDAERRHPDANITTYGEAVWWGAVTVATVGYGDHFPVTATGKFVAVALMLGGIGLLGVVTGSLAHWMIQRLAAVEEAEDATRVDVQRLLREVRDIREELATLRRERTLGDRDLSADPAGGGADLRTQAPPWGR